MKKVACPVRVGVVGCGSIARAHLNAYRQLPELGTVVALCDMDTKSVEARRAEFPMDVEVYTRLDDLLRRAPLDAVDICLPIKEHLPAIVAAAKAGKHILVEKPLTLNLAEAKQAVQAARENGVTLMVAHDQRFRPMHVKAKEIMPRLGRIICARADINQDGEAIFTPTHWHLQHRGCLLAIGVHTLDLLRFLVGEVKQVSCFERKLHMKMQGNDVAVAVLEFECGAVGTLMSTWASKGCPWHDSLILQGSNGAWHNIGGLFLKEGNKPFVRVEAEPDGGADWRFRLSYREEVRHFLECLRDRKTPMTCGEDNLKTMAAIEAMFKSSQEGRAVTIKEMLHE